MGQELAKMHVYRVYYISTVTNKLVEQFWYTRSDIIFHAKLDYDYQKEKRKYAENFPVKTAWKWDNIGTCYPTAPYEVSEFVKTMINTVDEYPIVIALLSDVDDYYASTPTEEVENRMIQSIKKNLEKLNKNSNFNENIKKEKSGGCFLTTSICHIKGKKDNCYELETLRKFRDNYLLATTKGKKLVNSYYSFAPDLAIKLEQHSNRIFIVEKLYTSFIIPIINDIEEKNNKNAVNKYLEMVNILTQFSHIKPREF